LIGEPELIMLDEPTAGIDPPNVRIIRDLIASQAANATFIISSHNLDELEKVCSTVVHLKEGVLQGTGNIDSDRDEGTITLTLRASDNSPQPVDELLRKLRGVTHVEVRSATDLIIEYDKTTEPNADIAILQALADAGLPYRRLIKGKSLEDQLFA